MLKSTKHAEYLCSRGLMRIDKQNDLVHLVGYPVLLQREIRSRLLSLFSSAQLITPSAFVRPAVLEGVNVDLNAVPSFSDGSSSAKEMYLVGHSLPSLLTPFIRSQFSEKNAFPIVLQSVGMGYHLKKNSPNLTSARQRLKHCLLAMSPSTEQMESFSSTTTAIIDGFLEEVLELDIEPRTVLGKELRNYESQAIVFEDKGLELARLSRADDYISRRLNISSEEGNRFMQLVYVETDIDRVIARLFDGLVDGRDAPHLLKKVMKS